MSETIYNSATGKLIVQAQFERHSLVKARVLHPRKGFHSRNDGGLSVNVFR